MSLPAPPRKPPIRHKVRSHTKKTPKTHRVIRIDEYLRGKGEAEKVTKKKGLVKSHISPNLARAGGNSYLGPKSEGGFNIHITYLGGGSDMFTTDVSDYVEAIDVAVQKAKDTPSLIKIERR